jgi:hypothetical protein
MVLVALRDQPSSGATHTLPPFGAALRADGAPIMAALKGQLAWGRPATLVACQLPGTQSMSPAGMAAAGEVVPANTPLM